MTNPIAANDLVSLDLARRLAELGFVLPHTVGSWYYHPMVGIKVNNVGGPPFDGEAGKNCLVLPRRIDCEAELVKVGYVHHWARQSRGRYWFGMVKGVDGGDTLIGSLEAPTAAEAVGLALEQAMKEAQ